jgi:hypothetical protein
MKKFRAVSLLVTVLLMTSMSFSLLKVEGTYSVFAKQAGLGFGVSLPVLPLVDTTFYIHMLGNADVTLTGIGNIGGATFSSGTAKMAATAFELQAKLPFSIMDCNVGATILADFLTGDNGSQTVAMPGSIYGGLFVQYQKSLMPLVAYYGQVGMLFKLLDGEAEVNKQASPAIFDMSNINRTGLYFRAGLSVGL